MKKMSDIVEQQAVIGSVDSFANEESWGDEANISKKVREQVYIKHFDVPIFFGFASKFQEMVNALPEVTVVVMRMPRVPYIDQSGIYAIEDAVLALKQRGIIVLMTGIQEQPKDMLRRIGLIPALIAEEHLFVDFAQCIEALEKGAVKANPSMSEDIVWNLN
jgi:SulP family sulfate permease